jgi:Sec-independent protein secretion pathway component TatC
MTSPGLSKGEVNYFKVPPSEGFREVKKRYKYIASQLFYSGGIFVYFFSVPEVTKAKKSRSRKA